MYLYGSFARGNPHEGSDIDLVLIGRFTGKLPYRILRVLETTELPIEPLCYTPREWRELSEGGNPLACEVTRTSILLWPRSEAGGGGSDRKGPKSALRLLDPDDVLFPSRSGCGHEPDAFRWNVAEVLHEIGDRREG